MLHIHHVVEVGSFSKHITKGAIILLFRILLAIWLISKNHSSSSTTVARKISFFKDHIHYSISSLNSVKAIFIASMARERFDAYFRNKSCCLPVQMSTFVAPRCPVTVTTIGYLSTLFSTISAPGKTSSTQLLVVENSCKPPSQLRLYTVCINTNFSVFFYIFFFKLSTYANSTIKFCNKFNPTKIDVSSIYSHK